LQKLINFSISVREGVWGFIFEFEGTSGGPCREFIFESPPVNAACALLLLFIMAEAVAVAEAEAVAEAVAEAEADGVADAAQCSETLPSLAPCLCLFLLQLLELPLPLQLLTVPLLSSQPFSWGLGLQEPGQGVHTGALGAHFNFHPQNHYK